MKRKFPRRSTPAGEHRPVLLNEILELIQPGAGKVVVDCTLGFGGHSSALLERLGSTGLLIGFDLDREHLEKAHERLAAVGFPFRTHHGNFAGLPQVLASLGVDRVDGVVADLGMSSMQVDDTDRGFSYRRPGPLDMRMDRGRGKTAAELLATMNREELARALRELGDEPEADCIADAIAAARSKGGVQTTTDLVELIQSATNTKDWRLRPSKGKWTLHPAARTFQVLRILVNRELANLVELLRVLPACLKAGGIAAIISFHSGEDRIIKSAFREGHARGEYESIAAEPIRATFEERGANPRSRSAKLRWARKS